VFYSVLFNTSPEGLPGAFSYKGKKRMDLDSDQALFLQKTAWETVLNWELGMRNSRYRIGPISEFRFGISD
jgi:hypothetical protein